MAFELKELFSFIDKPAALPRGTRVFLELVALGEDERCDHIAGLDYLDFDRQQSISGVFRVEHISTELGK